MTDRHILMTEDELRALASHPDSYSATDIALAPVKKAQAAADQRTRTLESAVLALAGRTAALERRPAGMSQNDIKAWTQAVAEPLADAIAQVERAGKAGAVAASADSRAAREVAARAASSAGELLAAYAWNAREEAAKTIGDVEKVLKAAIPIHAAKVAAITPTPPASAGMSAGRLIVLARSIGPRTVTEWSKAVAAIKNDTKKLHAEVIEKMASIRTKANTINAVADYLSGEGSAPPAGAEPLLQMLAAQVKSGVSTGTVQSPAADLRRTSTAMLAMLEGGEHHQAQLRAAGEIARCRASEKAARAAAAAFDGFSARVMAKAEAKYAARLSALLADYASRFHSKSRADRVSKLLGLDIQ